jgi:hypothetical protein
MNNTAHAEMNVEEAFVGPSAFCSAEIRLDELIDLDKFPIHDLTSP